MTNYRRAVSLDYAGAGTPTVSVRGHFLVADEIVRIARRYGVPVVEKGDLAAVLDDIPLDQEIPEQLYEAVAVIIHQLEKQSRG